MKPLPIGAWAKRMVRDVFEFNNYDSRNMRITSLTGTQDDYGTYSYMIKGYITRSSFQSVWSGYSIKEFLKNRSKSLYSYGGPGEAYSEANVKLNNWSSNLLKFSIWIHGGLDI